MDPTDDGPVAVCERSGNTDPVLDAGRGTILKIGIGFAVAGGVIYLVGGAVGWNAVRRALTSGEYQWLVLACLSTLVGLVAWSKAWQIVFSSIDIEMRLHRVVVTYLAATFANYVTPFGQVGGEPVTAYILSREVDASYEDSLTSVITVDLLNLIPFFSFAVLGLGVLTVQTDLPPSARSLAYGLALLAATVPAIVYVGWNHRWVVKTAVSIGAKPVALVTNRSSDDDVDRRIDRFYASLERVVDEPRRLLYALVFSYVGWFFFALPLFFAGLVLGLSIDPLLVLFIVPASALAGFVPTPGGLGGGRGGPRRIGVAYRWASVRACGTVSIRELLVHSRDRRSPDALRRREAVNRKPASPNAVHENVHRGTVFSDDGVFESSARTVLFSLSDLRHD